MASLGKQKYLKRAAGLIGPTKYYFLKLLENLLSSRDVTFPETRVTNRWLILPRLTALISPKTFADLYKKDLVLPMLGIFIYPVSNYNLTMVELTLWSD